mgnify:CR=1 FL=1
MPGLENWAPHKSHVQGGLPEGNYVNGQFIMVAAGPPFFNQLGAVGTGLEGAGTIVYPIGLTQNFSWSQNKSVSRIFELGSDRSYFISGRSIGQLSLGRVVYHGASLLRALYAYYNTENDSKVGAYKVRPMFDSSAVGTYPTPLSGQSRGATYKSGLKSIMVPPGYDNMFLNLASDLFSQPIGLLLIMKDNEENNVAAAYFEQCYVPQHSITVDAGGLLVQESAGIQYEKVVPIKLSEVRLLDQVLEDQTGGFADDGTV